MREPSEVRGRKSISGHAGRVHAATAVVGKGTPSVPPEDAVGVVGVPINPIEQETGGATPDRSRSRDPPREATAVAPSAQQERWIFQGICCHCWHLHRSENRNKLW